MADSALIDDLEKQFADNPRRVFARLANEYRKAGDAERAIEICRHHVPQQPGYISGHIVLGQALFDTAQFDEARSAFETALGLDPENLIALRQLGDIARETGDLEGAASWYRRLLEVDPQNEEVAEQLQTLEATASAAPAAEPAAAASEEPAPVQWGDIHPEDGQAEAGQPDGVQAEHESARAEVRDENEPADDTPSDDRPLPFITLAPEPAEGTVAAEASATPAPPSPAPEIVLDASALHESTPAVEPQATATPGANATPAELPAAEHAAEPAAPTPNVLVANAPAASEPMPAPSATAAPEAPTQSESVDTPAPEAPGADAFVTETMAELYVQQGFVEKALDIYRQLAWQSPDDARFQRAIEELEQALATGGAVTPTRYEEAPDFHEPAPAVVGPTIREFLNAIAARRATVRASAAPTGGASGGLPADTPVSATAHIANGDRPAADRNLADAPPTTSAARAAAPEGDDLFPGRPVASYDAVAADTLASGYLNGAAADDGRRGAPAHAASDELSLDAVFRATPPGNGRRADDSSVSFDQFFSGDAQAGSGGAADHADAAPPDASADAPSDLELFHAWLEGLKK